MTKAKPRRLQPQLEVPALLDSEDPWQQLRPGAAEEETARSAEEIAANRIEVAAMIARAFNNPDCREAFGFILRQFAASHPTMVSGWTVDQLAPMLIRRDTILDLYAWIEEQIEISLNANV